MEAAEIKRRMSVHMKFTEHARLAMLDDDIAVDDILHALDQDEVLERYPDAKPFQSCLLLGRALDGRPLHLVCSLPTHVDMLIIVTVYVPSEERWIDFRRRRES